MTPSNFPKQVAVSLDLFLSGPMVWMSFCIYLEDAIDQVDSRQTSVVAPLERTHSGANSGYESGLNKKADSNGNPTCKI